MLEARRADNAADERVEDLVASAEWDSDKDDSLNTLTYESTLPSLTLTPGFFILLL
jgi:hypothetical protein